MKETLSEYRIARSSTIAVIQGCLSNMEAITEAIDGPKDTELFVHDLKTSPFPLADFDIPQPPLPLLRTGSLRGFGSIRKRASLLVRRSLREPSTDDFSDLPPEQQKRRLRSVVEKLEGDLVQLEKNKEGFEILGAVQQQPEFTDQRARERNTRELEEVSSQIEHVRANIAKYTGYLETIGVNLAEERASDSFMGEQRLSRTSSMITLRSSSSRLSSLNEVTVEAGSSQFDVHTPPPGRRRSSATGSDITRSDTYSRSEAKDADADSLNYFRTRRNSRHSQVSVPELSAEIASIDSGPPPAIPPSPAALKNSEFKFPPFLLVSQ